MSYCNNCKKNVADGLNECPDCGAYVSLNEETEEKAATENTAADETMENAAPAVQPQPKKRFNFKSIISIIIAVAIGTGIGIYKNYVQEHKLTVELSDSENPGEEFTAVFEDNGIVPTDNLAAYPDLGHVAYVLEDTDGTIYYQEYGVKGDKISVLIETTYIPVADYTEADKSVLDAQLHQWYADVEALEFTTVSYSNGSDYYKLTVCLEGMDEWENIKAAAGTEAYYDDVSEGEFFYSIKDTEEGLLEEEGYVKK